MHELILRLRCKRPDVAKASLEPDIKNTDSMHIEIIANDDFIEIRVRGEKMGHIKAVMNSYLSIVDVLDKLEDIK